MRYCSIVSQVTESTFETESLDRNQCIFQAVYIFFNSKWITFYSLWLFIYMTVRIGFKVQVFENYIIIVYV